MLIENSNLKGSIKEIDLDIANKMSSDSLNKYHFTNYDSTEQFIEKSFGYCIEIDGEIASVCTASLVCKNAVEVSITTKPLFRQKGLATVIGAKFLLHAIKNNLNPHWDAANLNSCNLAKKLGYKPLGCYNVVYIN